MVVIEKNNRSLLSLPSSQQWACISLTELWESDPPPPTVKDLPSSYNCVGGPSRPPVQATRQPGLLSFFRSEKYYGWKVQTCTTRGWLAQFVEELGSFLIPCCLSVTIPVSFCTERLMCLQHTTWLTTKQHLGPGHTTNPNTVNYFTRTNISFFLVSVFYDGSSVLCAKSSLLYILLHMCRSTEQFFFF